MKRIVAFLAAVCVFTGIFIATSASAQDLAPPPSDASEDTVKTKDPTATAEPAAAPDTTNASAARTRRMRGESENQRKYFFSLGIGSCIDYNPPEFKENYSPAFGAMLAFGARQYGFTGAVTFGYNFFLADGPVPNDLSILTIFADIRFAPVHTKARPYILVCGGYWRQWVVDLDYTENVLGYGGGAGVEIDIDRVKRLFFDARYIQGQTRETESKANTEIIPIRIGVSWEFK